MTPRLVLFFTRGVSLHSWAQNGSLEREIALYLRLMQKGLWVSFVTYGRRDDLQYRDRLQGIEILCNRWNLRPQTYERWLPYLHAPALLRADVFKSNQTNGAEAALRAAKIWRKPFLARCGYMWSDLMQASGRKEDYERARRIEGEVFPAARAVVVTTPSMRDYVHGQYAVPDARIRVIPNFVLTDVFAPGQGQPITNRILFIGRLHEVKNLPALIDACAGLPVELHFVGEGRLRPMLAEQAARQGVPLTLHGSLPHHQLPDVIRQATVFALVSPHEGHPKSLLEAMSCGAAVLGADSPGIREQIIHAETGWLTGTDSASIRAGLQRLLADADLRARLGGQARRFILAHYSLERIAELEKKTILEIL